MFDRYVIKVGEDLSDVANKYHTTKEYLQEINNKYYKDGIRAGMEIAVPKNPQKYFEFYTIREGDSLYAISRKFNINPSLLASLNGLNMEDYIYPNQEILIPKNNYSYYITAEGDTLTSIANAFGVTESGLLKENETIYILPGQLLAHKKN